MKKDNCLKVFILEILITTLLSVLFFLILKFYSGISVNSIAVFSGWLLSLLNVVIGTRFILRVIQKDNKKFFSVVFGSMAVRIIVTLVFVVLGLLIMKFDEYNFIFSLFGFYFLFLLFEIMFLNSKLKLSKQQS